MDIFEVHAKDARPVSVEVRDNLLKPFIAATSAALGEMANTEVAARAVFQEAKYPGVGDIVAEVRLNSATAEFLILSCPKQTAEVLASRMLAGATREVDETLIQDCVGEIANVVAGQAKALLAGTPYRFTFSVPKVLVGADVLRPGGEGYDWLAIAFTCEQGDFTLQLLLKT